MNIIIVSDNFSGHLFHDIELFMVAFQRLHALQVECSNVYVTDKTSDYNEVLSMKLFNKKCQVINNIEFLDNTIVIDRNKLNGKSINKVFVDSIYDFPTKLWGEWFHHDSDKKLKILYTIRQTGRILDIQSHNTLCTILNRFDVTLCDMGTLSIEQQIDTFRNHNVVIGVHGNNLSGIMWMKPGSHVFEILHIKFKDTVYDYHYMSLYMKHHYTQIDCTGNNLNSIFTLNDSGFYSIMCHLKMLHAIYG